jgi:Rad3-related DNA helicase
MIKIFEGEAGSGKTLSCTAFAYNAHKAGKNIIADYNLNFPHTYFDKEDLQHYQIDKECLLALDNSDVLLDKSRYMANTDVVNFILQAEKNGADIFIVANQLEDIDKRIRGRIAVRYKCHYDNKTEYVTLHVIERRQNKIEQFDGREYFSLYDSWQIMPIT